MLMNINKYSSELHKFSAYFHQDFLELGETASLMLLTYINNLDKRKKKKLKIELIQFCKDIEFLDESDRRKRWFKLDAHYWDHKLDMHEELYRYISLLSVDKGKKK